MQKHIYLVVKIAEMSMHYQQLFMQKIKALVPQQFALADTLADLLDISKDAAYRRIRCETSISLDEVLLICEHFKITFESLSNPNAVTFNFKQLKPDIDSFKEYLNGMHKDLKRIQSFENAEIIYAAEDIPVFHHFNYPLLASFKIYYWMRSIMHVADFEGTKFNPNLIGDDVLALGKQINEVYAQIPSIEIWTDSTLSSTLDQIAYYWDAGLFEDETMALNICDEFITELKGIQRWCELGHKQGKSFKFFHNDIMIGNNCILIKAGDSKFCYLSHHSFNFMQTTDLNFSQETALWLEHMMQRTILLSGVSEKQRNIFFSGMIKRINQLKEKILNG